MGCRAEDLELSEEEIALVLEHREVMYKIENAKSIEEPRIRELWKVIFSSIYELNQLASWRHKGQEAGGFKFGLTRTPYNSKYDVHPFHLKWGNIYRILSREPVSEE